MAEIFWHSISFWHMLCLTFFLSFCLASILAFYPASILTFYLASLQEFILAFYRASIPTFCLALSGMNLGPSPLHSLLRSRYRPLRGLVAILRSGASWARDMAVGPTHTPKPPDLAVWQSIPRDTWQHPQRGGRREREEEKEGTAPLQKSREPDLALGEKLKNGQFAPKTQSASIMHTKWSAWSDVRETLWNWSYWYVWWYWSCFCADCAE